MAEVLAQCLGWTSARGKKPFDPVSMFLLLGWQITNGWSRAQTLRNLRDPLYWPKRTYVLGSAKMDVEPRVSDGIDSREWVNSATRSRSCLLNPDSWRLIEESVEMTGLGN